MNLSFPPGRLLALLLVLGVALVADLAQRSEVLQPAQAVWPQGADAVTPANLRLVARGNLTLPEGVHSVHASNLIAMPPESPAALTAFWFAGDRESAPNVHIVASQFDRRTQVWLTPRSVVDRYQVAEQLGFGVRRLGNPVSWVDASGRIHLFVVATGGGGWAAARILHLVQSSASSDLAGLAFEPQRVLPLSWLWNTSFLVRNEPLPLADGGMVLPVHFELGYKYPVALRFDRMGEFMGMARISSRIHLLQPTLLMQSPVQWLALMRDQWPNGHIAVAQTSDGGQSWQDLPTLPLVNPDAAINGMGLRPGVLVLAHNTTPHSRALLDLSSSGDGAQWNVLLPLAHGGDADEYSYPGMVWADGSLWVSYTDRRHSIAWQRYADAATKGTHP